MRRRSNESDSLDSLVNLLTQDLDQIGRFNLTIPLNLRLSDYLSTDALPTLANLGQLPALPTLPNLPTFDLRNLSKLLEVLADVSRYISLYVQSYVGSDSQEAARTDGGLEDEPQAQTRLLNSVKTIVSTRIQMQNFLHELNLGLSINSAIDRLQPLTDIIHETIVLPADDSDAEDEQIGTTDAANGPKKTDLAPRTEPLGVNAIVNSDQPLLTDLVVPEDERVSHHRHKRRKSRRVCQIRPFSDENDATGSDFDVDGLTSAEARALTHLNSLDDFYKEDLLRRKIQRIQGLQTLLQELKNRLVTRLMMGNYYKYLNQQLSPENEALVPKESDHLVLEHGHGHGPEDTEVVAEHSEGSDTEDEVLLTEQDQQPSYFDPPFNTILGCSHYQRNCKVECPTCGLWFPCRFCHDAVVSDHKLIRSDVQHILCMRCNTPQVPENNYCINCEQELANYFCSICVLYDNDPTKDIYHCDKCGICRLGLGLGKDYFHCDECNICLLIDLRERHKCVSNTTHSNCPICNEYLFTSVAKVVFMKCGHSIHQHCYDELRKHLYKCPICKKTVVNVETQFRILDQEIRQLPLPAPYNLWRCIISCNDCKGKSNALYHVLGLKCKYCNSYNTNQLKLIKPEEELQEESDMGDEETERRLNSMRLMKTSLLDNFLIDEQTNTPEEYDGDNTDEEDEEDDNGDIINLRRLTQSLSSSLLVGDDKQSQLSTYITSMLQGLINNATTSAERPSNKRHGLLLRMTHKRRLEAEMEVDS